MVPCACKTNILSRKRTNLHSLESSGIIIGIVSFALIVCCLIGKEYRGTHFEEAKTAIEFGGGYDNPEDHLGGVATEKMRGGQDVYNSKEGHEAYEDNIKV